MYGTQAIVEQDLESEGGEQSAVGRGAVVGKGRDKKIQFKLPNLYFPQTVQVVLVVKNLPANAGDLRNMGLIHGLGRCPGEGNSNPLQYSCLQNPIDRGVGQATVRGVTKSWT